MIEPHRPIAEVAHAAEIVGDEHECAALFAELDELLHTSLLERDVADREDLVDQQQFRVDVDGDGECKAHVHPR